MFKGGYPTLDKPQIYKSLKVTLHNPPQLVACPRCRDQSAAGSMHSSVSFFTLLTARLTA